MRCGYDRLDFHVVGQALPKLVLTERLRSSLKTPLGTLFPGEGREVYQEIAQLISRKKPPRVIFVGDAVSRNAVKLDVRRDLMIIDHKERRTRVKSLDSLPKRTYRVRNEPGTIGSDAWAAIDDAIETGDALMVVEGEEDLLTLVVMVTAPLGSLVVYGQPNEGLVLVEVNGEAREKACLFLENMIEAD